ncbi:hypothetical protein Trydic_g765 [Trypoxylus dichotomus]
MATLSAGTLHGITDRNFVQRSKRKLQKHLRSSGLAYISRTGKLIPAKKVPDELCQCPQKCDERVPMEAREHLFQHFYGLGDPDLQNAFLREHMDIRARTNIPESTNTGRSPRRITCKYLVPLLHNGETADVCQKAFVSAFVITTKRVRLQREKLISSMGLNSYSSHSRSTKNNNIPCLLTKNPVTTTIPASLTTENKISSTSSSSRNGNASYMVAIPPQCDVERCGETTIKGNSVSLSKQLSANNKSLRKRLVDDPLVPFGLFAPDSVTITPVMATPDHDRDIAIVNNFFSNQLWKPEYIGTYS